MDPLHPITPGPAAVPRPSVPRVERLDRISRERDRPDQERRRREQARRRRAGQLGERPDGGEGEDGRPHIDVRV
jgi:hypothetical protein